MRKNINDLMDEIRNDTNKSSKKYAYGKEKEILNAMLDLEIAGFIDYRVDEVHKLLSAHESWKSQQAAIKAMKELGE